jgi:hypothetical protein
MVEYNVIPEDEWNQIQAAEQKPDEWEPLLADLFQGKIVSLPYTDGKDRRRIRMSITRRAMSWGFKTEARYTETQLAVRRSDTPSTPAQAQPQRARRRRSATD